jgi:hypothetical protein
MFMRARFTEEVGSGEEEGFIDSGEEEEEEVLLTVYNK